MARRVRRDLSDKSVRKAVKQSRKSHSKHTTNNFYASYFRTAFYLILLIVVLLISFKFLSTFNFDNFFSSTSSENLIGEDGENSINLDQSEQQGDISQSTPAEQVKPVPQKSQIEILNGCGVDGIASIATDYCRKEGIDVVYNGNFRNYAVMESYIIGWTDNEDDANNIGKIIGLDQSKISFNKNSNKQLAASIILGADYKNLKPFKN